MGIRSPQFNFQSYRPRNDKLQAIFVFNGDFNGEIAPWRPCLKMVILAILTISPLKSPEIPIKNENGLQFVISWSITLKIELWAPYTHWQTVLKGQVILRQKG